MHHRHLVKSSFLKPVPRPLFHNAYYNITTNRRRHTHAGQYDYNNIVHDDNNIILQITILVTDRRPVFDDRPS